MKKAILLLLSIAFLGLNAVERGLTQNPYPDGTGVSGQAEQYVPISKSIINPVTYQRESWNPVDSIHIESLLRPGQYTGILFNDNQYGGIIDNLEILDFSAMTALQKVPHWIKADLENVLRQLNPEKQIIWSNVINNAQDPYIDEIAFCIAHSSVVYLNSVYSNPQLFIENAQLLYSIDSQLSYVQIIDHGNSMADPDYYSTTKYRKMDNEGNITEIEVPKEIYYWYIVHPKTSDEIPAYIDPNIVENNSTHNNNIVDEPTGKFWRQYFFYESENNFPILGSMLDSCQVVWNPSNSSSSAIHTIQAWINNVMDFDSNTERPHQPMRILRKGIGRCGEHGDMTIAATRSALIPCTSIVSASTDHVWNEFWDDGWHHWEPVNNDINNPLVYENGWGKVFGSVFEQRSDGYLQAVTDRYSSGVSTINLHVFDNNQNPIDGASVILAINDNGSIRFDMLNYTDNEGYTQFIVGDNRHYYVRVNSLVGSNPLISSQYLNVVDNSVNGEIYNFQVVIDTVMALYDNTQITTPADDLDDYRISISFNSPSQVISGFTAWDDINVVGENAVFYKKLDYQGKANVQYLHMDQLFGYQLMTYPYESFDSQFNVSQNSSVFNIPQNYPCYAGIDTYGNLKNLQLINGSIILEHYSVGNHDNPINLTSLKLNQNYPNPFNPSTTISFTLTKKDFTEISIYNTKGQKVRKLSSDYFHEGTHQLIWNGNDDNGSKVSSGIYFLQLKTDNKVLTKRMLLMK